MSTTTSPPRIAAGMIGFGMIFDDMRFPLIRESDACAKVVARIPLHQPILNHVDEEYGMAFLTVRSAFRGATDWTGSCLYTKLNVLPDSELDAGGLFVGESTRA